MKKLLFLLITSFVLTIGLLSCGGNVDTRVEDVDSTEVVADTSKVNSENVSEKDSLVRCRAITKKGTQCERLVVHPDTLCFQHAKMLSNN